MGRKSSSVFAVGVFTVSALVTYNIAAFSHGHGMSSRFGHHMGSHLHHLEDKHDAFSFEPHVVAKAGGRSTGRGGGVGWGDGREETRGSGGHEIGNGFDGHGHGRLDFVFSAVKNNGDGATKESVKETKETIVEHEIKEHSSSMDKQSAKGKFHVLLTANDAPYQRWQSRVMYFQFLKLKKQNPDSAFGGFTRILHSGHEDSLMDEIPTVIVDTLPKNINDEGYVVLHRPYAFQQWIDKFSDQIPEEFILMSEPDHLFIKPPPLLATHDTAVAFPFFYIEPTKPKYWKIVERFNEALAPKEAFAPIGSSPVMISLNDLKMVVPKWNDLAIKMKKDKEANDAFGWVVEMWAYSIASAQVGVKHELVPHFMLQPPYDKELSVKNKDAFIIHYTYGDDFDKNGKFTGGVNQGTLKQGGWHFDKRDFTNRAPRKGELTPPPRNAGAVIKMTIDIITEAMDVLPNWGV